MTTISVVVPATDRPATLPRCTAALHRAAAVAGDVEIVVVQGPRDLDVCAARNTGARRASGDVVIFVDADVEVHPDALARVRTAFAGDPGLTAVFGSYDDAPPGGTVAAFRNLLHHHVHQAGAGPAGTFWSGLGAIRRDAFLAAGGFDGERFPQPSIEDVDLGVRLVAGGARIVLDPAIQGTHLKAWTLRSMVRTDFARRGVPWVALLLRSGQLRSAVRSDVVRRGPSGVAPLPRSGQVRSNELSGASGPVLPAEPSTAAAPAGSVVLNLGWRHRASAVACATGVAGALLRRPTTVATALLVLLGANRDFYALLARRRGPAQAAVGVGLHVVHHLTALAAVPAGVAAHLRDVRRGDDRRDGDTSCTGDAQVTEMTITTPRVAEPRTAAPRSAVVAGDRRRGDTGPVSKSDVPDVTTTAAGASVESAS